MTITLDDVSCLLHLSMVGKPINYVPFIFSREAMKLLLMTRLGISTEEEARAMTTTCSRVRSTWLTAVSPVRRVRIMRVDYRNLSFALDQKYNIF